MFAVVQFVEVTEPIRPSKDHWPQFLRTFFQSDDKPLVMVSTAFLQAVIRVEFPKMYVGSQNARWEFKQFWKGLLFESVLQVNFQSPMFWENTWVLLVNGVADPVERQAREVPAGGKRTAGDPLVAQPQIVMLVPLAYLIIINKNYYTDSPHFGAKAPLKDGFL